MDYEIDNYVFVGNIGSEVDLEQLAKDLDYVKDKGGFPGVVVDKDDVEFTVLIFSGGDITVMGSSEGDVDVYTDELDKLLPEGFDVDDLEIANMQATTEFENVPTLSALNLHLGLERSEYEPEVFPSLRYKPTDDVLVQVFDSGQVIVVGADNVEQIEEAIEEVKKDLDEFGA